MKKYLLPILYLFISYSVFSQISFVNDIYPGTTSNGSTPDNFFELNGNIFFIANHDLYGQELWITDGTFGNTSLFMDINPGSANGVGDYMIKVDNILYFFGDDGESGEELWRSDGTVAGTYLVKDIVPGPASSYPERFETINNKVLFIAYAEDKGRELWVSDGTEEGTNIIEICPGSDGINTDILSYTGQIDTILYFAADDGIHGKELWRTNGTEPGTFMVKDMTPGSGDSPYPIPMGTINNMLIFRFDTTGYGSEVWVTDGTSNGTKLLKDINPGSGSSYPSPEGFLLDGFFYFTANDGTHGKELWRTDGTGISTNLMMDINLGSSGSDPRDFFVFDDVSVAFFVANDGSNGNELWVFDGISAPKMVKDINSGTGHSYPSYFVAGDSLLFFRASDGIYGSELWATNGTESGTRMVKDIQSGGGSSYVYPNLFYDGTLFMSANDGVYGNEPWISKGDDPSTQLLKDINDAPFSSSPSELTGLNGKLIFNAKTDENDNELWSSEGTEASTILLKDINPGTNGSDPCNLFVSDDIVFFAANDGNNGNELWATDGTLGNPQLYADIYPGGPAGSDPEGFCLLNDMILFSANGGFPSTGTELHMINSSGDVELVKDIYTGDYNKGNPDELTCIKDQVFFIGTFSGDRELGITDGTSAGTNMIKNINSSGHSYPKNLTAFDSLLYFTADDGTNGEELWVSDGTLTGTNMFIDLYSGGSSSPGNLVVAGNKLFFKAYNEVSGDTALYVTGGTAPGTEVLLQYNSEITRIGHIEALKNQVFFTVKTDSLGAELWISDGSVAGTKLLKDICPGSCNSSPNTLYAANHQLFFNAYDPIYGLSLWVTDGTTDNTVRIPTPAGEKIEIEAFEAVDSILYFSAKEISTGQELWKYECTPPTCTGLVNDSVCEGTSAMFVVATDDTAAIFRWQENQGAGFADIIEGGDYVMNNDTLIINNVDTAMDGYKYRCIVEGSCFTPTYSDSVSLVVKTTAAITQDITDASVCFGDDISLKCIATGTGLNSQWQVDEGSGFVDVVDGTHYNTFVSEVNNTSMFNLELLDIPYSMNNNSYRCVVTSDCSASLYSDTAQLTVDSVMILSQTTDTSVCNGGTAVFNVNVVGQSVNYQWQLSTNGGSTYTDLSNNPTYNGVNTGQLTINGVSEIMDENLYTCIISNACQGGLYADAIELTLHPTNTPVIQQDEDLFGCVADTVNLSTTQVFNAYTWSTGVTTATAEVTAAGDYYVTVVDGNSCESVSDAYSLTETTISVPSICLVGVDMETGQNMVVWDRVTEPGIADYIIYRESNLGGVYNALDTIPFDSLSVWVDMTAQPEVKSYKYKISAVDQCGYETTRSPYHKTMLLTSNIGPSAINLSWQEYELEGGSFGFVQYIIYRGSNSTSLEPIDTIASDNTLYPDFNAPVGQDVYYRIAGVMADVCDPKLTKASAGPFSQAVSNLEDNRLKENSIDQLSSGTELRIYPNPASDKANIVYTITQESKVTIKVYNILGGLAEVLLDQYQAADEHKLLFNIDQGKYPEGLYYIELVSGDKRIIKKLTISR